MSSRWHRCIERKSLLYRNRRIPTERGKREITWQWGFGRVYSGRVPLPRGVVDEGCQSDKEKRTPNKKSMNLWMMYWNGVKVIYERIKCPTIDKTSRTIETIMDCVSSVNYLYTAYFMFITFQTKVWSCLSWLPEYVLWLRRVEGPTWP